MKHPAISISNLSKEQLNSLIPNATELYKDSLPNMIYLNKHLNVRVTGLLMSIFMTGYSTGYKEVHTYEEFMQLWEQLKLMELL